MYPCLIRTIKFYLVLFTFFAVSPNTLNAQQEPAPKYHLLQGKSFVESKNYYLLKLCRLAALQYAKGVAPFIVTSGGKVHPYKTKFCEATEMKRYLVEKLHIPANAIIVDPHARHTTTNMRNAARLIYRYGIPLIKPALPLLQKAKALI